MVTRAYIDDLLAIGRFFETYDQSGMEATLLANLRSGLPDWDHQADSILRRALPLIIENVGVAMETNHANLLRTLVAFAEGPDLDILGLGPPPTIRRVGEPDADYRLRIINAYQLTSLGSLLAPERQAVDFDEDITHVRAYVSPNRQDVRVYVLPFSTDLVSLQTELQVEDNHIAGVVVTAAYPVVDLYRLRLTPNYDPLLISADTVDAALRVSTAVEIGAAEVIGEPVYANYFCARLPSVITVRVQIYEITTVTHAAGELFGRASQRAWTSEATGVITLDDLANLPASGDVVMTADLDVGAANVSETSVQVGDWLQWNGTTWNRVGQGVVVETAPVAAVDADNPAGDYVLYTVAGVSSLYEERVDDLATKTPALGNVSNWTTARLWRNDGVEVRV